MIWSESLLNRFSAILIINTKDRMRDYIIVDSLYENAFCS
jgi:hypothetical protein